MKFKVGDKVRFNGSEMGRRYYDTWFREHFPYFDTVMVVKRVRREEELLKRKGTWGYGDISVEGSHYVCWSEDLEKVVDCDKYGQLALPLKIRRKDGTVRITF